MDTKFFSILAIRRVDSRMLISQLSISSLCPFFNRKGTCNLSTTAWRRRISAGWLHAKEPNLWFFTGQLAQFVTSRKFHFLVAKSFFKSFILQFIAQFVNPDQVLEKTSDSKHAVLVSLWRVTEQTGIQRVITDRKGNKLMMGNNWLLEKTDLSNNSNQWNNRINFFSKK